MASNPGGKRQTLMKCTRKLVEAEDAEERLDHAKSLKLHGQLHHIVDDDAATVWSDVVQRLPPECLKFALNVAQDTLPHNANLSVWRREAGLSGLCKLCNQRQTLLHALNHCQVALELRRYNQRHDNVLQTITDELQKHCPPEYQMMADLPNTNYDFPSAAASTDLRPDLVMWSDSQQVMVLTELTVCFETNFVEASQRKKSKYQDLLEACMASGYTTELVSLEVGSRGFVNLPGFKRLFRFFSMSKKDKLTIIRRVSREALIQSHRIWTSCNKAN